MDVIEIDGNGKILRRQDIPDDWTVEGGVITSPAGHRVFPPGNRWYRAPVGAEDGGIYDSVTGLASPPLRDLTQYQQRALSGIREQAREYIESAWPIWRQINADAGIYPPDVKAAKDADIAAVITESNRIEDLIGAATDVAGVNTALESVNWPAVGE